LNTTARNILPEIHRMSMIRTS